MPVIQRPNTDAQRLEALESAKLKADVTPPAALAFSADTLALLLAFLPNFRTQMQERGTALSAQSGATLLATNAMNTTEKFVSHFIHVFNLGIDRDVYTRNQRAFFQLDVNQESVPILDTPQQVSLWANRIIDGDPLRVAAGGAPMSNPTAAEVAAKLALFIAAEGDKTTKKDAYDQEQEDVAALRAQADAIIRDVWDEVEFTFRKDSPPSKRRKAREYGVVYRLAKGETPSPDDFSIIGKVTNLVTGLKIEDVVVRIDQNNTIVVTDEQGNYYLPVQNAGSYTIQFVKNGYEFKEVTGVQVTTGAITTLNVQLVPAAPASTGTVNGLVTQGGNPAQGVITVVVGSSNFTTHTLADGTFTLTGVPAGTQTVQCVLDSNPASTQNQNTNVPPGGTATVNFSFA